jgi:hypothetical protein
MRTAIRQAAIEKARAVGKPAAVALGYTGVHQLAAHLERCGADAARFAWPLLRSAMSEVLTRAEWEQLWDTLLVRAHDPSLLPFAVVAYLRYFRGPLLAVRAPDALVLRHSGAAAPHDAAARFPFAATGGAQPGLGAQQCGSMMYSELLAAAPQLTAFDNATQSDIAYFSAPGADGGHTAASTWVSYNGPQSVRAITKWAASLGLQGVFVFDASMDSANFTLMNAVADAAAEAARGA